MKALRATSGRVVLDAAAPDAAGEAVVRVTRALVFEPEREAAARTTQTPVTLGSHVVGVVESVAADRQDSSRWVGRRVAVSPVVVCGLCARCRAGLSPHCQSRRVLGVTHDGGLAERCAVPIRNLVEIPRAVHDDAAVFCEPLAAALLAASAVRVQGRAYITVLGDTAPGLLAAAALARLNASVRLVGADARRLELCDKWGVKHRPLAEVGLRQDQDVVVETTGSHLDEALGMVRPRGTVVVITPGSHVAGARSITADLAAAVTNEISVLGLRAGRAGEALETLAQGHVDPLPIIGGRVRLAEAASAFAPGAPPAVLVEA